MIKIGSIFSGVGGWELGALSALGEARAVWGVDIDPLACRYASINVPGASFICADARSVDWRSFEPVDILFASPPCQAFSHLSTDESRLKHDLLIGLSVVSAVEAVKPKLLFLENVTGYIFSEALAKIVSSLSRMDYAVRLSVVDMEYWGVPQTRKRMILSASSGGSAPVIPRRLFPTRQAWGELVLPFVDPLSLPESDLSDWQVEKGAVTDATMWVSGQYARKSDARCWRGPDEPLMTITASIWKGLPKIVLPTLSRPVRQADKRVIAAAHTFPPSAVLPDSPKEYCKLLGNVVPPAFSANLMRSLSHGFTHWQSPLFQSA